MPAVTLVINYNLPLLFGGGKNWESVQQYNVNGKIPDFETYLHRIGRTGRFGLKGISINLCDYTELAMQEHIGSYYSSQIEQLDDDFEKLESKLKDFR